MKTIITMTLAVAFFFSCKSADNLSNAEQIANITKMVESGNYTFVANSALPMSGKSINLTSTYFLKVRKDTIESYLPYYGRAYVAPSLSDDGGIKFVSTDFDYTISDKKKGAWDVSIIANDNRKRYRLSLDINDNGNSSLTVHDNDRQSISFYGKIE